MRDNREREGDGDGVRTILSDSHPDVGVRSRGGEQRALNLGARHVGRVHDAAVVVAALLREVQATVLVAGELGAHLDQLENACRALAADNVNSPGESTEGQGRGKSKETREARKA